LNAIDHVQALSRAADSALEASVKAQDSAVRKENYELGMVAKALERCNEAEAVAREAHEAARMVRREVVEAHASLVGVEEALEVPVTTTGYYDASAAEVVARSKAQVARMQLTATRKKAEAAHTAAVAAILAVGVALSMTPRASGAAAYGE